MHVGPLVLNVQGNQISNVHIHAVTIKCLMIAIVAAERIGLVLLTRNRQICMTSITETSLPPFADTPFNDDSATNTWCDRLGMRNGTPRNTIQLVVCFVRGSPGSFHVSFLTCRTSKKMDNQVGQTPIPKGSPPISSLSRGPQKVAKGESRL